MDALRDNADVVVIGGGPTGSTAANILSKAGWRVLLIEKERFPRHHVGESLLPALDRLYGRLGVREALRRERFFLKRGGAFLWGRSRRLWSIDVTKAVPLVEKGGRFAYHVQRDRFDELLLQACRRRGARVVEGAAVVGLDVQAGELRSVLYRRGGVVRRARAKYYIDASGQAAVLARQFGWRRFDPNLRNMALYSYFQGGRLPAGASDRTFVASFDSGWTWYIPLSGDRVSVGVVVSVDRAGEAGRLGLEEFYARQLRRVPAVSRLLSAARRLEPVRLSRDWSYRSASLRGRNFLLAGDAAAFIDPLLSYGVTLGMHSGELAADCVDIALRRPREAERALGHYESVHGERFDELLDFTKYFYDANRDRKDYFWKARSIADHEKNSYSKAAFTYVASGHGLWDKIGADARWYFGMIFAGLGAPRDVKDRRRFKAAARAFDPARLTTIDDRLVSLPPR